MFRAHQFDHLIVAATLRPEHEAAISAALQDLRWDGFGRHEVEAAERRLRDAAIRVGEHDLVVEFPALALRVTLVGAGDEPSRLARLLRR